MNAPHRKNARNEFLSEMEFDLSELDSVDLFGDRVRLNVNSEKFLGLFSEEEVRDLLNESGIIPGLLKKGFKNWKLSFETEHTTDQRLIIVDEDSGVQLVFMRLHIGSFSAKEVPVNLDQLRLLFIDWLLLQNPRAPARPEKLFPGQKYPGNGLFPEVKHFMVELIRGARLDGAANLPEFFHDAVLFADRFKFLHPRSQGEFEAILRDLGRRGLRNLSRMVHSNAVNIHRKGEDAKVYDFRPGEMVVPNSPELAGYFSSSTYAREVARYANRVTFSIRLQPN